MEVRERRRTYQGFLLPSGIVIENILVDDSKAEDVVVFA